LRICHVSDNHGILRPLYGNYNLIVHSGDFFPDPPGKPIFKKEIGKWQLEWLEDNIEDFIKWVGNNPFLFTLGNHDHADPNEVESLLKSYGITAFCLHDIIFKFKDIVFYGFPYVPYINGQFAYELNSTDMLKAVKYMVDKINNAPYSNLVNVLVCHCPPFKILDLSYSKANLGNTAMLDAINLNIKSNRLPEYYLTGHVHNSAGIIYKNNILFSNAATTRHIIEI